MLVVEATDLRRSYRTRTGIVRREKKDVEAVRGVSFGIERGELFGLLGPNGAGKTTTIKMLITLLIPTSGQARVLGQDVVADLRASGTTILLTTHYMFEADELCDRIAVIAGGRIVAEGTPADLKAQVGEGTVVEVEVFGDAGPALVAVDRLEGVRSSSVEERGQAQLLVVRAHHGAEVTQPVLACLTGLRLGRVATREPTLEDAYVELVSSS